MLNPAADANLAITSKSGLYSSRTSSWSETKDSSKLHAGLPDCMCLNLYVRRWQRKETRPRRLEGEVVQRNE